VRFPSPKNIEIIGDFEVSPNTRIGIPFAHTQVRVAFQRFGRLVKGKEGAHLPMTGLFPPASEGLRTMRPRIEFRAEMVAR
jgi:hypothetical protein